MVNICGSSEVSLRRYAEVPSPDAMSPLFSVGNLCPIFFSRKIFQHFELQDS